MRLIAHKFQPALALRQNVTTWATFLPTVTHHELFIIFDRLVCMNPLLYIFPKWKIALIHSYTRAICCIMETVLQN